MSATDDIRSGEIARADQILREVCDDFLGSLAAAASHTVARRYAAVPSWYAIDAAENRPLQSHAAVPSWCVDEVSLRRLLADEDPPDPGGAR